MLKQEQEEQEAIRLEPTAEPPPTETPSGLPGEETGTQQPVAPEAPAAPPDPAQFLSDISALAPDDARARLEQAAAQPDGLDLVGYVARKGAQALALAAVTVLGAQRNQAAATVLAAIGLDRSNAAVAKEARRALHKLSLVGIKPGTMEAPPRPEPAPDKVYACLASTIDAKGEYSVTIATQNRFGTLRLAVFVINEEKGIVDVQGADPCSMSLWKRYLGEAQQAGRELVPVELAFARRCVETAQARNERSHTSLPEGFYHFFGVLLIPSEERPLPPELQPDAVRADEGLLARSVELCDLSISSTWTLSSAQLRPYTLKLITVMRRREPMQSQQKDLPLPDLGDVQMEGTIVSMTLNELFDGALRSHYQARLDYTADILWRADRMDQARVAKAAALALAPESNLPLDQHPFLREMVRRNLRAAMALELLSEAGRRDDLGGRAAQQGAEKPDEYVDEQGFIRRKSGLILPR